ncbi:MAG: hypothetical protein L6Q60_13190 [Rhodocyclaceae bacterium]|nr:hypothetical protein [Rhodocyclaceae bacterium]
MKKEKNDSNNIEMRSTVGVKRSPCEQTIYAIFAILLVSLASAANADQPLYTLTSGKGWTICETYLKSLNATPANEDVRMRELKPSRLPDMQETEWEERETLRRLKAEHRAVLWGNVYPAPEKDFDRWKLQWEAWARANGKPYLKFFTATPAREEVPMCDLRLTRVPGMREPDWEELDIAKHLEIVHQIELLLGVGYIEPAPEKDFKRWKVQREARVHANGERPRLRRTQMTLVPNGPVETVLTYDFDVQLCEKEKHFARLGLPFSSELGKSNFFIYDEAKQKVAGSSLWTTMARGVLTLFQGKPYFLNPGFGWDGERASGGVKISRLEAVHPNAVGGRMHDFPDDPLYGSHELCEVRFDYPFPLNVDPTGR